MTVEARVLSTLFACFFLAFVFTPLERARPARPSQGWRRPGLTTDLAHFVGQHMLFGGLLVALLVPTGAWLSGLLPAAVPRSLAGLPWGLQALLVTVLGDLTVYGFHRLQHASPLLWRFHAVHHSPEHLDWVAAHREHPGDSVLTLAAVNLPALALGFPLVTLAGLHAFRGLWATFLHSNVHVSIGPLALLVGSPGHHRRHHAPVRHPGNYANLCPWIDLLFGTYRAPDAEPGRVGLDRPLPTNYLGQLLQPVGLWPRRARADRRPLALSPRTERVAELRTPTPA